MKTCCFLTSIFIDFWLHFGPYVEAKKSERKELFGKMRSKSAQERPKSGQERPKSAPRASQSAPRPPQERPRAHQDASKTPQDAPKCFQYASKATQNAPRMVPRRPSSKMVFQKANLGNIFTSQVSRTNATNTYRLGGAFLGSPPLSVGRDYPHCPKVAYPSLFKALKFF